ncbi:outer membrane beta-barrel protein [candidate division KSB1 bacterium]|nr:outer membrane beta-barrel protein [candidate division KSB1 bacterium]
MKKLFLALVVVTLMVAVMAAPSWAQKGKASAVAVGNTYIGPAIGLWENIGFSANFEKIFKDMPDWNGLLGWGVEAGYSSDKKEWSGYGYKWGWKYTYIPIYAFVSYHYKMTDPKLDPYARLGLGYVIVSASEIGDYEGYGYDATDSYVDFSGQIGVRYKIGDTMWLRAALGTPWIVSAGIDFQLK